MKTIASEGTATLFLAALAACANPAADKPRAHVAPARPATGAAGRAESIALTPQNTRIEFVGAKLTESHDGSFGAFTGNVELDPRGATGSVSVDIDTASVRTPIEKLTGHLKSPDFFDAARFPRATFASTAVTQGGAGGATHTVTGNFTLHGVTKSISFPARITATDAAIEASAEFSINRKDFGIVYPGMPDNLIRDDVLLRLTVRAARPRS